MGIDFAGVTVAVPFVRVNAAQNPNHRVGIGIDPAAAYFRAMVVAFASIRKMHPDIGLKLMSDAPAPEQFLADFAALDVAIDIIPFDHRPPKGFTERFEASLFMLDALAHADADITIFIDPDVLCVAPLDGMLARAGRQVGAIWMKGYSPEHNINGLSRRQAGELHALLGEHSCDPVHFGGEIYMFPRERVAGVRKRCEAAWALTLSRHAEGLSKFTTEEHILSYALRGGAIQELNDYAARIWTAKTYRNVDGSERKLAIWHLPAEKDRGFASIYAAFKAGEWPAEQGEFMDWAARKMGVYNRSPRRIAIDALGYIVGRARKLLTYVRG